MAYEVVCDLRHTDLLHNATDTCSWAYSSVDALHGLNLLMPNQVCSNNQLSFMRSLTDHVCNHDVGWTLRWEMCDLLRVLEFYHADSKNKKVPNLKYARSQNRIASIDRSGAMCIIPRKHLLNQVTCNSAPS